MEALEVGIRFFEMLGDQDTCWWRCEQKNDMYSACDQQHCWRERSRRPRSQR